jgi:hypothetical protein
MHYHSRSSISANTVLGQKKLRYINVGHVVLGQKQLGYINVYSTCSTYMEPRRTCRENTFPFVSILMPILERKLIEPDVSNLK